MRLYPLILATLVFLNPSFAADPATYACPMKCEQAKIYSAPGQCPVCHMDLEPVRRSALSSTEFALGFETIPVKPSAGGTTHLRFTPKYSKDGSVVRTLQMRDGRKMNAVVASSDLAWFGPLALRESGDGRFDTEVEFPFADSFVVFAGFTPEGAAEQVIPVLLTVTGKPLETRVTVRPDAKFSTEIGPLNVALFGTEKLKAGSAGSLRMRISSKGKNVKLDRPPEVYVVSSDRTQFSYSHSKSSASEQLIPLTLPTPGVYRLWLYFSHGKRLSMVPFTFRVSD